MAYKIAELESLAIASSIVPSDPGGYASGDMICFLVMAKNTLNTISTATSGWSVSTAKGTYGNNSLGAIYKSATSSSETMPTITVGSSVDIYSLGVVLGDVPSSAAVDLELHGSTGFTGLTQAIPTSTTGAPNTFGLWLAATSNWAETIPEVGSGPLGSDRNILGSTQAGVSSGWWFEESSGVTSPSREFWLLDAVRNRHCIVISFKSDTAAIKPVRCDVSTVAPWDLVCAFHDNAGYKGYTLKDISTDVTSLDTVSTTAADSNTDNNTGFGLNLFMPGVRSQSVSTAAGTAYLREYALTAVEDFSTSKIFFYVRYGSGTDLSRADTLANHGLMVGLRSGGIGSEQYRFFDAAAFDTFPSGDGMQIVVIDPSDVTNRVGSDIGGGSFNLSDIRGVCTAFHSASNSVSQIYLDYCGKLNRLLLVGGDTSDQMHYLDWSSAKKQLRAYEQLIAQLGDTFESKISIQIGNGTDETHFHTNGQSFSFPNAADFSAKTIQYQVYDSSHELIFQLDTGNTATFDAPIDFKGGTCDVSDAGNANATWAFNSAVWKNVGSWSTSDIGAISNLTIQDSATLDNELLDLSGGGCVVTGSTGVEAVILSGATEAELQTALADVNNCALNNSAVGLRLEHTGTGDIALIINGTTFSGNTVDVHYNSTSASELTITPSNGTVISTTAFSGSATGVVVDSSTAIQVKAPNLPDGTFYEFYNNTQGAVLATGTVTGGAGAILNTLIGLGLSIEEGDEIELRPMYNSGTSYKEPDTKHDGAPIVQQATTAGVTFLTQMVDWDALNTWGHDPSTLTEFSTDLANIDIDLDDADGISQRTRIPAYWAGSILTTADGIRNFWGAFTVESAASIKQNVSTVDVLLHNTGLQNVLFNDDTVRYYRSDGSSPYDPSGNSIFMHYNGTPHTVDTGSGGFSASDRADLQAAKSSSASASSGVSTAVTAANDAKTSADLAVTNLAVTDGKVDSILEDTGITLPGRINTVEGKVDATLIAANDAATTAETIDGKVDQLPTTSDEVNANVKKINDGVVIGDGSEADPWREENVLP